MEDVTHIGTCGHELEEDWYNSDESTYLIESEGMFLTVTTCPECKKINVQKNMVRDYSEIPFNDGRIDTGVDFS